MQRNEALVLADRTESWPSSLTVRDLVAVGFRRQRVLICTFLPLAMVGAVLALVLPVRYRSEMKILLERTRQHPTVSAEQMQPAQIAPLTEDELNSEVELLNSDDLLRRVVVHTGLDQGRFFSLSGLFRHDQAFKTAKAVRRLADQLSIEPSKKTDVLVVRYASGSPQLSHTVLTNLQNFYLEKHARVHHSSAEVEFFDTQKQRLWEQLSAAEQRLVAFPDNSGAISGTMERDVILQKLGDLKMKRETTASAIEETKKRIGQLRAQIAETPKRITTQQRHLDNPQLMQYLQSTLLDLELKRSALLQKYQPTYRPIQELDKQIAIARATIAKNEESPLSDVTTDIDTAHQWLRMELAKDQTDLQGLEAEAKATERSINAFEENARKLNTAGIEEQDLTRETKVLEESYQLYARKAEEARINQALDRNNILNVSIAEPPTFPILPERSRVMYVAIAISSAFLFGTIAVVIAEYLDKSFRTPSEVQRYLDLPVYASLPARTGKSTSTLGESST